VEYLGIWTFGDVNCSARPNSPVNNWVSDRAGPGRAGRDLGEGKGGGEGYMERPQNQQGSCLATWEGPGDGLSRLAAFYYYYYYFGAKFTQLANSFFQNG
jgi:hypothetical protein